MIRRVKVGAPEKTYFISDPHFNHTHPEILAKAGVSSVEELNESRVATWNAAVPPDADVFVLGDFCLHDPDGSVTKTMLRRLNGRNIYLIWGNHNSGVKKLYREELAKRFFKGREKDAINYEVYPLRSSIANEKQVVFVGSYLEVESDLAEGYQLIVLSHYAHRQWLRSSRDSWMLCGHSHGNDHGTRIPDAGIGKILEVSFEVIDRPLNLVEIGLIMSGKTKTVDHRSKA